METEQLIIKGLNLTTSFNNTNQTSSLILPAIHNNNTRTVFTHTHNDQQTKKEQRDKQTQQRNKS